LSCSWHPFQNILLGFCDDLHEEAFVTLCHIIYIKFCMKSLPMLDAS
jgi:hypothetical protein